MRSLLLTSLCLVAASARAQTTATSQFYISFGTADYYAISGGDCATTVTAGWTATELAFCSEVTFWTTQNSCGSSPDTAAGDIVVQSSVQPPTNVLTSTAGTLSLPIKELPSFRTDAGVACGAAGVEKTHRVCGSFDAPSPMYGCSSGTTKRTATSARIVYDTAPPQAPSLTGVSSRDGALGVTWSEASDVAVVLVQIKASTDTDYVQAASVASPTTTYVVTNLTNNTAYDIRLIAADVAGNESVPSNVLTETPLKSNGFWGQYRDAGGSATGGGCATAPGLLGWGAVVLSVARRKRRKS